MGDGLEAGDLDGAAVVALGEELLEVAQLEAGVFAGFVDGGDFAVGEVVGAEEADDVPMFVGEVAGAGVFVGFLDGEVFVPVLGVDEEALVVDVVFFFVVGAGVVDDVVLKPDVLHVAVAVGDAGDFAGAAEPSGGEEFFEVAESDVVLFAGDVDEGALVDVVEGVAQEVRQWDSVRPFLMPISGAMASAKFSSHCSGSTR